MSDLIKLTSLLRMRFVTNDTCHKAADRIEELERERDHEKWLRERAEDFSKAIMDQRDAALADNARIRDDMVHIRNSLVDVGLSGHSSGYYHCIKNTAAMAETSLSATPEQSLEHLLAPYKAHIARLREAIEYLWSIIDDIDTYGDMAKADDKLFRAMVERRQKDRWKSGITTDGQTLDIGTPEQSLLQLKKQILWEAARNLEPWHMDAANNIRRMINESTPIHSS